MKLLLTKKFTFEMAHALPGYDGKCANIHGHSYHLEVTVSGKPISDESSPKNGMVADFGTIKHIVQKNIIDRFDHALILPTEQQLLLEDSLPNLILVPFQPTTEQLLIHFSEILRPLMPAGAKLHSLRLAETESSVAELLID